MGSLRGEERAQASPIRHAWQHASGQPDAPEVLPGNWTEATPCHVRPGIPLCRESAEKGPHSGQAGPHTPCRWPETLISILPEKPSSQQLPPRQAGGRNWNALTSSIPLQIQRQGEGGSAGCLRCQGHWPWGPGGGGLLVPQDPKALSTPAGGWGACHTAASSRPAALHSLCFLFPFLSAFPFTTFFFFLLL